MRTTASLLHGGPSSLMEQKVTFAKAMVTSLSLEVPLALAGSKMTQALTSVTATMNCWKVGRVAGINSRRLAYASAASKKCWQRGRT